MAHAVDFERRDGRVLVLFVVGDPRSQRDNQVGEGMMRFHEKDFEIPQVCLDLGFEDRSYHNEQSARMYNPTLDLTLWVNGPVQAGYVTCYSSAMTGTLGEVETDDELRELVASVRTLKFNMIREG